MAWNQKNQRSQAYCGDRRQKWSELIEALSPPSRNEIRWKWQMPPNFLPAKMCWVLYMWQNKSPGDSGLDRDHRKSNTQRKLCPRYADDRWDRKKKWTKIVKPESNGSLFFCCFFFGWRSLPVFAQVFKHFSSSRTENQCDCYSAISCSISFSTYPGYLCMYVYMSVLGTCFSSLANKWSSLDREIEIDIDKKPIALPFNFNSGLYTFAVNNEICNKFARKCSYIFDHLSFKRADNNLLFLYLLLLLGNAEFLKRSQRFWLKYRNRVYGEREGKGKEGYKTKNKPMKNDDHSAFFLC